MNLSYTCFSDCVFALGIRDSIGWIFEDFADEDGKPGQLGPAIVTVWRKMWADTLVAKVGGDLSKLFRLHLKSHEAHYCNYGSVSLDVTHKVGWPLPSYITGSLWRSNQMTTCLWRLLLTVKLCTGARPWSGGRLVLSELPLPLVETSLSQDPGPYLLIVLSSYASVHSAQARLGFPDLLLNSFRPTFLIFAPLLSNS